MENYLLLNFQNAGLFRKNKDTKDKIYENGVIRDRIDEWEFKEPITVFQISNILHVLWGKRPVPSHRHCSYNIDNYLFEKAMNSFLKINTYKNSKGEYPIQVIQTVKSVPNSHLKQKPFMSWEKVKNSLEEKLFNEFVNILTVELDINPLNMTFYEIEEIILKTDNQRILNFVSEDNLKKHKKTSFNKLIFPINSNDVCNINKDQRTLLTICRSIDTISRLSGQILVPINDDDMERIEKGKGHATLLDGGIVEIVDMISPSMVNTTNFIQVSQISNEKI